MKRVHGYLAEFTSVGEVYHAAEQVRDAGFTSWDVHSPFPIHGLDAAMGLPPVVVGLAVYMLLSRSGPLAGLGWPFWLGLGATALQLAWQAGRVDIHRPADCLAKFRSNRVVGWLFLIGIVAAHLA